MNRELIEQVQNYCYFCSKITKDDRSKLNIISRIIGEKRAF